MKRQHVTSYTSVPSVFHRTKLKSKVCINKTLTHTPRSYKPERNEAQAREQGNRNNKLLKQEREKEDLFSFFSPHWGSGGWEREVRREARGPGLKNERSANGFHNKL